MGRKILAVTVIIAVLCTPGCKIRLKTGGGGYKVGDFVEVQENGEWWNAEILELDGDRYHVSLKGFDQYSRWVEAEDIRPKEIPLPMDQEAPYKIGDAVAIDWGGEYWPAEILHVAQAEFYLISYPEVDYDWADEWLPEYRLKDKKGLTEGSRVEVWWNDAWWPGEVVEVRNERLYLVNYWEESSLTEEWLEEWQIYGYAHEIPQEDPEEPQDPEDPEDPGDVGNIPDNLEFPEGFDAVLRRGEDTRAEGLLYYTQHREGSCCYYFGNSMDDITHVVVEDNGQFLGAIIYDENLYPVHWLFEEVTMAAMWSEEEPFAPENALIKLVFDEDQLDMTLDISMDVLTKDLLAKLPGLYGEEFGEVVPDLLAKLEAMGWSELSVAQAAEQAATPHELAMASMLTTASVVTTIVESLQAGSSAGLGSGLAGRQAGGAIRTLSLWGDLGDAAVKSMLPPAAGMLWTILRHLRGLADGAYDGAGIAGPTVGMLLCRGASTVPNYCNHFYLYHTNKNLGRCVAMCVATLGCFTDICMPVTLSVEEANGFRTVR